MNELNTLLDDLVADAPVSRASWDDIVARARRGRRRRAMVLAGVVGLLGVILVSTPAFGIGNRLFGISSGTPVGSEQLTEHELHTISAMIGHVSPRLPASRREDLGRFRTGSLREIAVRHGRAYFVADRQEGGLCTSIADVDAKDLLGGILCSPDFPSPSLPILDWSGFASPADPRPRITRLEGFAADGVASVGVLTVGGELAALTPVQDNVYLRTDSLPSEPILGLVAIDDNGRRLYSLCLARGGCAGN